MKILIWTKSPPKVKAIKEAVETCVYTKDIEVLINAVKVSSDISDMPLSLEENMLWAKNRAENCRKEEEADFYIWMEWWTTKIWESAYLFWVVYILNNLWEWHYGFSPLMEIPKNVEEALYINGEELWPLMSRLSGEENIWHKNWSFWLWSDDQLSRKDQFVLAFTTAISPFFNKYYK